MERSSDLRKRVPHREEVVRLWLVGHVVVKPQPVEERSLPSHEETRSRTRFYILHPIYPRTTSSASRNMRLCCSYK